MAHIEGAARSEGDGDSMDCWWWRDWMDEGACSDVPTPWAVRCPCCGLVYFTEEFFLARLNDREPYSSWPCPICFGPAEEVTFGLLERSAS